MTEAEWLKCGDWKAMVDQFRGRIRKYQLFLCAWNCLDPQRTEDGDLIDELEQLAEYAQREQVPREDLESFLTIPPDKRLAGASDWSSEERQREEPILPDLIRCVLGNPFRRVTMALLSRTPIVITLAQATYQQRVLPYRHLDPHRLAVLADALEETGAHAELVAHLRGPGPHVRGCWAVDLCLKLK